MARYKVEETYTPDDTKHDRVREEREFECDSTDLIEIACKARLTCRNEITPAFEKSVRKQVTESADQLEDQDAEGFSIILFTFGGQVELDIEKLPD